MREFLKVGRYTISRYSVNLIEDLGTEVRVYINRDGANLIFTSAKEKKQIRQWLKDVDEWAKKHGL